MITYKYQEYEKETKKMLTAILEAIGFTIYTKSMHKMPITEHEYFNSLAEMIIRRLKVSKSENHEDIKSGFKKLGLI